jgi:branched-chain amino acid aminotransferase
MHRLILHNDELRDAGEQCTSPGQVGLLNGWGVFSTLRVAEGVLFAFERHWARMQRDATLLRVPFPERPEWLHSRLLQLVEANSAHNATLRVAIVRNQGGPFEGPNMRREFDLIAFTTDLTLWPESVALTVKPEARYSKSEFSGTKVLSWAFNLTWNEEAHERGFDEVVLLNERCEVSECTSANIFAIEGDRIWTPPLSSGCLPGITRAILLEEISISGFTIDERTLTLEDLERADHLFITSSTRDVLPVRAIESLEVRNDASEVVLNLRKAFAEFRRQYVARMLRQEAIV